MKKSKQLRDEIERTRRDLVEMIDSHAPKADAAAHATQAATDSAARAREATTDAAARVKDKLTAAAEQAAQTLSTAKNRVVATGHSVTDPSVAVARRRLPVAVLAAFAVAAVSVVAHTARRGRP